MPNSPEGYNMPFRSLAVAAAATLAVTGVYISEKPDPVVIETSMAPAEFGSIMLNGCELVFNPFEPCHKPQVDDTDYKIQAEIDAIDAQKLQDFLDSIAAKQAAEAKEATLLSAGVGKPPTDENFDLLSSACEAVSEGWVTNTHNGYYGGLQMDTGFWNSYGGSEFAPTPDQASREEQIIVARRGYYDKSPGAPGGIRGWTPWPTCMRLLHLR